MQFITLGNYTINTSAIAYIEWEVKSLTIIHFQVPIGSSEDSYTMRLVFRSDSREAQALWEYFKNPRTSQDLVKRLEMVEAIEGY